MLSVQVPPAGSARAAHEQASSEHAPNAREIAMETRSQGDVGGRNRHPWIAAGCRAA